MAFGITKDNAEKPTFAYVLVAVVLNGLLAAFWTYCAIRRQSTGDMLIAVGFWLITVLQICRVLRSNTLANSEISHNLNQRA